MILYFNLCSNFTTVHFIFQLPLPVTTYSLQDLVQPINPFYRSILPNPINQQQSTYQHLDRSQSTQTWQYLKHYINLIRNPAHLYKELFPPYPAHGVLFYPDLYMDFKGHIHRLNCRNVILLAHELYGKKVLILYGKNAGELASSRNSSDGDLPTLKTRSDTRDEGELSIIMKPSTNIRINSQQV